MAASPFTCPMSGMSIPQGQGPHVREILSGRNGTFEDSCEQGNLVEYECEYSTIQGPATDPGPFFMSTGNVKSTVVDCAGRCVDGACPRACPTLGDTLRYVSIDLATANATFEDTMNGRQYACEFYSQSVGYDCRASRQVGDEIAVSDDGLPECPQWGNFELGEEGMVCGYYRCVLTQPPN